MSDIRVIYAMLQITFCLLVFSVMFVFSVRYLQYVSKRYYKTHSAIDSNVAIVQYIFDRIEFDDTKKTCFLKNAYGQKLIKIEQIKSIAMVIGQINDFVSINYEMNDGDEIFTCHTDNRTHELLVTRNKQSFTFKFSKGWMGLFENKPQIDNFLKTIYEHTGLVPACVARVGWFGLSRK